MTFQGCYFFHWPYVYDFSNCAQKKFCLPFRDVFIIQWKRKQKYTETQQEKKQKKNQAKISFYFSEISYFWDCMWFHPFKNGRHASKLADEILINLFQECFILLRSTFWWTQPKMNAFPHFNSRWMLCRRLPKKEWRLLETFVERCYGPLSKMSFNELFLVSSTLDFDTNYLFNENRLKSNKWLEFRSIDKNEKNSLQWIKVLGCYCALGISTGNDSSAIV